VPHGAGPLNRIGRDLGSSPPFRRTVRDVCGPCNNGWMSRLEDTAKRVLTPFVLGHDGTIQPADQAALTAWAQKTALVAMLVSADADREHGYGLPAADYRELYAGRTRMAPLGASQYWIGRYEGVRGWSVRATPFVLTVKGLPEPELPHGYLTTILVGKLVLHGTRFTTPSLQVSLESVRDFEQLCPPAALIARLRGSSVDDETFLGVAAGHALRPAESHLAIRPWKPATELVASKAIDDMVELPTICGEHAAYYPAILVREAMRGRFHAFVVSCDCGTSYLIHTEHDGAHCKTAGNSATVQELYARVPGEERYVEHPRGRLGCRRLNS
jgi:hypothetical protein